MKARGRVTGTEAWAVSCIIGIDSWLFGGKVAALRWNPSGTRPGAAIISG